MQECLKMLGVTWLPISSECFLTIAGRFGRCLVHKENEPFRSNWVSFYVFFPRAFERRVLYKNEMRYISYIFTSSHLTSYICTSAYLTSSYLTPALLTSSLCLSVSLSLCLSVSLSLCLSLSLFLLSLSLSLHLHPLYLLFFYLLFFSPSPCLSYFLFLKAGDGADESQYANLWNEMMVGGQLWLSRFRTLLQECDFSSIAQRSAANKGRASKTGATCVYKRVSVKARVCNSVRVKARV